VVINNNNYLGKTFLFPQEIACIMLGFKISLATAFMLSLIIPFLEPVNGLYDISELQSLRAYCFLHADRAAKGEAVVNDLIKSGLADSTYQDWSCIKITEALEAEQQAESAREQAEAVKEQEFRNHCEYGNLTPSQYWECDHAGYDTTSIFICLFEEDREEVKEQELSAGGITLRKPDFSLAEPLTPAEQLECRNAGHEPVQSKDKDTKE
jgi:hypothetical protein